MLIILTLLYLSISLILFRLIKLPIHRWSVSICAFVGIFLLSGVMIITNYYHPQSTSVGAYYVTIPIVPKVTGTVLSNHVVANQLIQKGDVLFDIDPEPFQYQLDSLQAQLKSATEDVKRLSLLGQSDFTSQKRIDEAIWKHDDLVAQVSLAKYNLDNTVVRAPENGYVTQNFVKTGTRVTTLPVASSMTFIPQQDNSYVAFFTQSVIHNLTEGASVDIAVDAVPGKVFNARVEKILPYIGGGQVIASATLLKSDSPQAMIRDKIAVKITIEDKRFNAYKEIIPNGNSANVAIYSDKWQAFAIVRKIIIRINSWTNFLS